MGLTVSSLTHGARRLRALLTLRPFDRETLEGRDQERYRRATLSSVTAVGARFVTIAISLLTIPLTLGYLGPERFGIWITISSLQLLMAFADFGLGNGLVNLISAADGRNDRQAVREAVSSAFFLLLALGIAFGLVAAAAIPAVDWAALVNARSSLAIAEVEPAIAAFAACFAVGLPLGIVARVQMGLQEGFESSAWTAVGSILTLVALLAAIAVEAGLPWLVLSLFGGPVVASAVNALILFGRRRTWVRPRWGDVDGEAARRLIHLGGLFFLLQLVMAVAFQKDILVAANVIGPTAAAEYGVAYRVFMLAPALLTMVLLALWPAYGEAVARGDNAWVVRTLRRSIRLSLGVTIASSLALLLLHEPIIHLWIGTTIRPQLPLLAGMATWAVLSTTFSALSVLLNGIGLIRFQVAVGAVMATVSVILSVWLAGQFGVAGVIWGTVIAYALCSAIPTYIYVRRVLPFIGDRQVARIGGEGP